MWTASPLRILPYRRFGEYITACSVDSHAVPWFQEQRRKYFPSVPRREDVTRRVRKNQDTLSDSQCHGECRSEPIYKVHSLAMSHPSYCHYCSHQSLCLFITLMSTLKEQLAALSACIQEKPPYYSGSLALSSPNNTLFYGKDSNAR